MQINIWIVSPYIHSSCFNEMALALRDGLRGLGHESEIVTNPKGKTIILGAHLLSFLPAGDYIIFNTEQIQQSNPWLTPKYLKLLYSNEVWDYSPLNIKRFEEDFGGKSRLCEIGYMPVLSGIEKQKEDIDVLFCGSINERRRLIIEELKRHGLQVSVVVDQYGARRDALIARAKIVLNIHFYEAKVFEIVRCSYLMANRKCIVSEFGEDGKLESPYYNGIQFCNYEEIVKECLILLGDEASRDAIAERGFEIFKEKSQIEILRKIV